ncbi:MAG: hypothetical protein JG782_704 [Anaerophaga sp.]|uniref:hypothetical protein n=1 Tax=Anaerophaga thermohalophila TaxID=177400 RepID=UPI00035D6285|nr:hypothetical protein [Anaerophaga thermohalophila]MBZ4676085.1 hypothetical protein [Anaerophaga sp.]
MRVIFFIIVFSFLPCLFCLGQNHDKVRVTGIVCNKETRKPLNYAQLVSFNTLLSHTTDSDGNFAIYLGENDSVKIVSMGFEGVVWRTEDFLKTKGRDTIFMEPATYMLNEVTVNAHDRSINLNLPGNIGINVDPDADPDRSVPKPSVGMISSPLTLAHSAFSKKAKNQRNLKKAINKEKEMALWNNILASGLLKEWTELEGKELEDFTIFCNTKISVSKTDNVLTIYNKVTSLLNIYKNKKE